MKPFDLPRIEPEHRLREGTVVASYVIEGLVGEGGMSFVYAARHRILPRRVALKVMRDPAQGAVARERVLREACVLAALRHPALVEVFDAGVLPDGRAWLAMNMIDGQSLNDRIQQRGRLDPREVIELCTRIADVAAMAHLAGVIHRDLKPDNILLVKDSASPVRVIDWGIAQAGAEWNPRLTQADSVAGTPFYMSPEQARGEIVDGRCDVYALGVVAYQALAGRLPFDGDTAFDVVAQHLTRAPMPLANIATDAPRWLTSLVMTMLAKKPAERPSMADVAVALTCMSQELEVQGWDGEHGEGGEYGDGGEVIEIEADMAEDSGAHELDEVIAELPGLASPRFARGSGAVASP